MTAGLTLGLENLPGDPGAPWDLPYLSTHQTHCCLCSCSDTPKAALAWASLAQRLSGKSSLHTSGEGAHVIALESW